MIWRVAIRREAILQRFKNAVYLCQGLDKDPTHVKMGTDDFVDLMTDPHIVLYASPTNARLFGIDLQVCDAIDGSMVCYNVHQAGMVIATPEVLS